MSSIKGPIAVIDVGAHFARLEIVQVAADGKKYETLERLTQVAPLGMDVFTKGKISTENTFLVGKILKDYALIIKEYKVKFIKAVATSAVREASNSELFRDRVEHISGIKLEELEASTEARIIFMALRDTLDESLGFFSKNSLVCSIGTGATQVLFVEKGILKSAENTRLGSLRLLEELERPLSTTQLKEVIKPFVESAAHDLIAHSTVDLNEGLLVGTGSSVRALLHFAEELDNSQTGLKYITKENFDIIYNKISALTHEEIAETYKISDTLAQSLEPCCAILYHFFHSSNAEKLVIPAVNTRDAIIRDFLRQITGEKDPFIPYLVSCIKTLGEKYCYDSEHAENIAEMSRIIFENTQFLHGLSESDALLLQVAAYLHDIGIYVDTRKHHKHSQYLIKNSHIPGIASYEQNLIALIARYHRRGIPKSTQEEYITLSTYDKVRINSLAAILRVADALDFIHNFEILKIKFDHKKKVMEIVVDGIVDTVLENWASKKKADLFKEVFGYKVRITGR
jgi:exopolyphosphatase/guanosine-5'-triphosphate,3'-diphosphate pyrophosphatase